MEQGSGRESGATAVEYAIMVALIATVIFAAVVGLGRATSGSFECFDEKLDEPSYEC